MISLWGENSNISVSYGVHMCKHFVWLLTHLKKVTWCQWCLQRCCNGRVRNSWAKVFSLFYFSTVTVIAVLKVEASWLIESGTYLRLCHQRGVRAGDCPTVLPTRTRASCSPPPNSKLKHTGILVCNLLVSAFACLWRQVLAPCTSPLQSIHGHTYSPTEIETPRPRQVYVFIPQIIRGPDKIKLPADGHWADRVVSLCRLQAVGWEILITLIYYIQHACCTRPVLLSSPVRWYWFFYFLCRIRRQRVRSASEWRTLPRLRYSPAYCILSFVVPDDVHSVRVAWSNKQGE